MSKVVWKSVKDWSGLPEKGLIKKSVIDIVIVRCYEAVKSTGVTSKTIGDNNSDFYEALKKLFNETRVDPEPEKLKSVLELFRIPVLE